MRFKTLITSLIAFGVIGSTAFANDCLDIHDNKARLACYDKQAGYEKKPNETNNNNGIWVLDTKTSPVDDSTSIFLSLTTKDRVKEGLLSGEPLLIIRCQHNTTDLYINWGTFITMGNTNILTRIDKEKAQTSSWLMSTNNEASFAPKPIPLIKEMFDKDTLTTQITPFSDNTYTVKFNISGLENAIKPVREACGW